MGVDEPRQHGHGGEVDDRGVLRLPLHLGQRPDGDDAVAFNEDADVRLRRVGSRVDQAAGFDEGMPGRRVALSRGPGGDADQEGGEPERYHGRSSLKTAPPFITKVTFSSVATSASGSPCTAITSA